MSSKDEILKIYNEYFYGVEEMNVIKLEEIERKILSELTDEQFSFINNLKKLYFSMGYQIGINVEKNKNIISNSLNEFFEKY